MLKLLTMNTKLFSGLVLLLTFLLPLHSQEDVNLFDYWKFYSDVENSQYKSSCRLAFEQLREREAVTGRLSDREDFLARQDSMKKKLAELIGPFPGKTPLNARVTGVIRKEDYRVEKVIYESMPGYYVTAALFIPKKRKGKAPAIIYASGHTREGFRSETYQHICINLVKKGFIVLAFDPIGQGERLQYYVESEGKSRFGATDEHSYPGAQCYVSGYSPAKYFIWDGIRSVDYLLTRKEVDPERIGMTGRSGGGTQTAYIAAMEPRILAAAPECFITKMEYQLKTGGPQDAEQNLFHMISEGVDHADLLEVRAPRPGLMITTTRDFFSIQGARDTYAEVKRFYDALGAGDRMGMVEDDNVHTSTRKNREAMYAFFQQYLENPGSPDDLEVETFPEEELWATPTGQLATSLKGETIFSLNRKVVQGQQARLKLMRSREDYDIRMSRIKEEVKQLSGFKVPVASVEAVFSGRFVSEHHMLEKYLVPGEGDLMLPAALFKPLTNAREEVVLLLDERGMEKAARADSIMIHAMLEQGYAVLLFDVRGIGSMGPGYLKGDAYIDNTSFNQWFASIMTNRSIVAMRAADIVSVVHFAETGLDGYKTISAISLGPAGSELLHAALFEKHIQKVCLVEPFLSYTDFALSREYTPAYIPSIVAGAIEKYDLTDLMAAVSPRKLLILNPLSAGGEPATDKRKTCHLLYPENAYRHQGVEKRFSVEVVDENQEFAGNIITWLNQ